jgi:UDP-2,3-diacylglucosamine hydrolase
MRHGHATFVSDLHLYSRRSQAGRYLTALHAAAARSDTFVLGGDIFDFRWSTLPSPEETVRQALRWLDELVASHPRCQFHFVLGNHDCNRRFVAALETYSASRANLAVHPYVLRLGNRLFLHGDAVDHPRMCPLRLSQRRQKWAADEMRSPMRHVLYDLAVTARLHRLAGKVAHPRRRVVHRLLGYLQRIGHGPEQGVEHVYFGHTHDALEHYRYRGITFHNPGAPMAGLKFRIVETTDSSPAGSSVGQALSGGSATGLVR